MAGVNKAFLLGNLTADPERRTTGGGTAVVNVRLATNETFKNREGERQERTEYHRVTFWGRQGETIEKYAQKGTGLWVEGRIQTREWTDRDGNKRWTTTIVGREFQFTGKKAEGGGGSRPREERATSGRDYGDSGAKPAESSGGDGSWGDAGDDQEDLPF